tara:strand:+ start:79 stop:300 length:222 start_codon:yes stop_codon:yes gene_type:complete
MTNKLDELQALLDEATRERDALREAFAKRAGTTVVSGDGLPHCKIYFETLDDAHNFDRILPRPTLEGTDRDAG